MNESFCLKFKMRKTDSTSYSSNHICLPDHSRLKHLTTLRKSRVTRCHGVTGQSIPLAGLYPGLQRPRLDYTGIYYGLGQFIPPQAKLYTHDINHNINSVGPPTARGFHQLQ